MNRWLWLACRIAALWDDEVWHELATRGVRLAREMGALSVLPLVDSYRAGVHLHAGEFAAAAALMEDSSAITQTSGSAPLIYPTTLLAAYRGDEGRAIRLLHTARRDAIARGQGLALSVIECSSAVLFNGLGHYKEAVAAAERGSAHEGLGLFAGPRSRRPRTQPGDLTDRPVPRRPRVERINRTPPEPARRVQRGCPCRCSSRAHPRCRSSLKTNGLASRLRRFCSAGPVQKANTPSCQTLTSGTACGVTDPVELAE